MSRLPAITSAYAYGSRPSISEENGIDIPFGYFTIEDFISIFIERERALIGGDWRAARSKYRSIVLEILGRGEITAFLNAQDGRILPIPQSDWKVDADIYTEVTRSRHSSRTYNDAINDENIHLEINDNIVLGNIIVSVDHAINVLSIYDPQKVIAPDNDVSNLSKEKEYVSSKAGRPPKYDIETFMLEMMSIVMDDGRPNTQAEMRERSVRAYVAAGGKGGEPDEEWVRKKVARFWNRLQLGEDR